MNPLLLTDFYKIGHPFQYPQGTQTVYSNLTPRKSMMKGVDEMVFFGLQYFIKEYLEVRFNRDFFNRPKDEVMKEYKRTIVNSLGAHLPSYKHIEDLHDLGYLPILIKSIPEGRSAPMRVPVLTIVNTLPEFYWLTNFIESLMSAVIWQPCTSATIAKEYRRILDSYGEKTGIPSEFIQWQGHDFSFRGMSSLESAITSGMGHLLSFTGTDTIPAILGLEKYYNADSDKELIGGSVNATEHSVMCAGDKDGEFETFKRLITEVYPTGIVSIVSDTWDLWEVLTDFLPRLKDEIMARDGKVVIRPDSGDPVKIITGYFNHELEFTKESLEAGEKWTGRVAKGSWIKEPEQKGVIELLWDVFGGTINEQGYKVLDPHIGAIYGDSITLDRANEICSRLERKGFASQVVFGIGSFTYQYNTRDTFGTAMKATYVKIDGEGREIYKEPVTDDGTKISAKGLLQVVENSGTYELIDQVTWQEEIHSKLQPIFQDGNLLKEYTLKEIRENINE
jgi:nicotinamide phosphoribosyltransferase